MKNTSLIAVLHCHPGIEGDTQRIGNISVSPDMPFNRNTIVTLQGEDSWISGAPGYFLMVNKRRRTINLNLLSNDRVRL
jgi:hypothetical protein